MEKQSFFCEEAADSVSWIGAVGMPKGYPIDGVYGETAAERRIHAADGRE